MDMDFSLDYGSHLPLLIKLVSMTDGPILELGGGLYSTPFLHWACFASKRELVTYDSIPKYFNMIEQYNSDFHKVILVDDWDSVPLERQWSMAFVDHWPLKRRKHDIARLANFAKYIVVHDTEISKKRHYNYEEIYPLFKYIYKYRGVKPHTSVLSNFCKFEM